MGKIKKSLEILKSDEFMPAAGQGIIVVQSLKKNKTINKKYKSRDNGDITDLKTITLFKQDIMKSWVILLTLVNRYIY